MRTLILFRHAKSSRDDAAPTDHDRPLSPRGRTDAAQMGRWLAALGLRPDLVLCSTARRTRETWALAAPSFGPSPPVRFEAGLYLSGLAGVMGAVRGIPDHVDTCLIVGHNPDLERTARHLATAGADADLEAMHLKYPAGAIAVIALPVDRWAMAGSGTLRAFASPGEEKDLGKRTEIGPGR
jgi:phosphohistidine phosphatase